MSDSKTQPLQPTEATAEKSKQQIETDQLNAYLREHKIKLVPGVEFPIYKKLPVELELALAVINRHEPQFAVEVVLEEEVSTAKQ